MSFITNPPFKTYSITVPTGTAATLISLINAQYPTDQVIGNACRELTIQADPGNAALIIYVGDAATTTARFGLAMAVNFTCTYRSNMGTDVPLANFNVIASSGAPKMNIQILA